MKNIYRVAWQRTESAGQAMVEFAMVVSVFLLMLFGIMLMTLTVSYYNTVNSAAREAVRYAIVHSPNSANPATTAQIQQIAIGKALNMNPSQLTVTVSWPADATLTSQIDAQVSVSYLYQLHVPFMSAVSLTVASTAQMLVSQ
ncbi:MAG: TadE/TadG family type IV pilus assembly protein [Candidatus Binatus sp.]|jgi:Flp pilus assembly protein TadG